MGIFGGNLWWKKRFTAELSHVFCWKNPSSVKKPADFNNGEEDDGEENVEIELRRSARLLFPIKEETEEDLESEEDGKSKGSTSRRLCDFLSDMTSPNVSPRASPTLNAQSLDCYNHHPHAFNSQFESSVDAEINRVKSSPPPKLKFLKDAVEKLLRKLIKKRESVN